MIVFISNFFNHHQLPFSEEMFNLTNGDFLFIECMSMPDSFKKKGYPKLNPKFLFRSWESKKNKEEARKLILNSEVALFGGDFEFKLKKERILNGKLTFEVGERWLKKGWFNILSPRLLKDQINYHLYFYNKPFFRLNASAYAANDLVKLHTFKDKMFKWGYFTKVYEDFEKIIPEKFSNISKLKILFVGRFLKWKHPEIPVLMAERIKEKKIPFELNMYGGGPELKKIKDLIVKKNLHAEINLCGSLPNIEIIQQMREHHVFLFTSDEHEGWGAVLNEAMSCKCAVIASDKIGSVPFLIQNNVNGIIFKNKSVSDLTKKIEKLASDPSFISSLGKNAFDSIKEIWSPHKATKNLLTLINNLLNQDSKVIENGPCSPALPINSKYYED